MNRDKRTIQLSLQGHSEERSTTNTTIATPMASYFPVSANHSKSADRSDINGSQTNSNLNTAERNFRRFFSREPPILSGRKEAKDPDYTAFVIMPIIHLRNNFVTFLTDFRAKIHTRFFAVNLFYNTV